MNKDKNIIIKLRDEAIKGYDRIKPQLLELENGYLALINEKTKDDLRRRGKSRVAQKIILSKVRKIERDILKTYFANSTLADIEIENDVMLTTILQKHLDDLVNKKLKIYTLMRPSIRDMLIYGTSVVKVYWSLEQNQIKIQPKKISEVLIDPFARNLFDAKYFVDRFYMSVADIKERFKGRLKGVDFTNLGVKKFGNINNQPSDLGDYMRVPVYEVYRKIGQKWYLSTLIDDYFVRVDVELKDGHPFCFGTVYPQFIGVDETGSVMAYGASYIEPMIAIQEQFITTRNQQMDAIYQQLNPRFLTTRNSGLRDDDLKSSTSKVIVSNIEGIKPFPTPNINQSIFDVNRLDEEIQEVGGLPKLNQGISSSTDPRSATGMNLIADSGNATIDDIITSFNESLFESLVQRIVKLIYKYKIHEDFVGYDRNNDISLNINVNAGVGAMSRDIKINNIGASKQSLITMTKVVKEIGALNKAIEYIKALDALTVSELKTLGQKNVEKLINEEVIINEPVGQAPSAPTV